MSSTLYQLSYSLFKEIIEFTAWLAGEAAAELAPYEGRIQTLLIR